MKVILTDEVLGLGDPGEVVEVAKGYGRNYLVPRGLAIQATKKNIHLVEAEQKRIKAKAARETDQVKAEADALAGTEVTVKARSGETGRLFGSVTNMDIASALAEMDIELDRRRILMEKGPLKELGQYTIKVKLHPHVVVEIQVTVEPAEGSIMPQPKEAAPAVDEGAEDGEAAPEEAEAAPDEEEQAEAEAEPKE